MNYDQAETLLDEMLAPLPSRDFFADIGRAWREVKAGNDNPRRFLLGEDPKRTILEAYRTHAETLDCHSITATQPPPPVRPASSAEDFEELIGSFHDRDYTVRVPDVTGLTPQLERFGRALEYMLHQPVGSSVFWSRAGGKAVVHYDNRDNIIIQLEGRKRWFVSTEPPGLQNNWKQVGEPLPNVQQHRAVDVGPGDLIYIPRGTPHTVESTTESLHLSLLFVPLTLREAIIAALDYASDFERPFRETVASRPGLDSLEELPGQVSAGLSRLVELSRSPDFVTNAMRHRSSRVIADLPALEKQAGAAAVSVDTRVHHSPVAVAHLRHSGTVLDFSLPGGHIAIHPGVERELEFIAATPEFRVGDLPGAAGDDVKVALVNRLVAAGFLEPATD